MALLPRIRPFDRINLIIWRHKLIVLVFVLLGSGLLIACTGFPPSQTLEDQSTSTEPPPPENVVPTLQYELGVTVNSPGPESALRCQVKGSQVQFDIKFFGGGGDNDKAKLETNGKILTIQMVNADQVSQTVAVLYHMSGKISGLGKGQYTLRVQDSLSKIIGEESFVIR